MEVLVTVVEAGSMAAAARRLDMTAQMVGRHIQLLEERLGASVLVRTTRRQRLTSAGHDYYRRCKSILDDISKAERAIVLEQSEPRGRLRITAPVTLGTACLAPALVDFMARHPRLSIDLQLDDSVVDLVGGGFDAAIRVGTLADSGLVARPLAAYELVVCASPEYLRRHGEPASLADLLSHQTLGFAHWPRHGGWQFELPGATGARVPESRLTSNVGAALRTAALSGFGLVMQPAVLLQGDIDAGRLVRVLGRALAPSMPVHLVFPKDRLQLPKMRAFIDFVVANFSESLTLSSTPLPSLFE
jgi:DNA-binding transcriptional LysR family regulator